MSDPYAPGGVWKRAIDFRDGNPRRDKYCVLLKDTAQPDDRILYAITTSQGWAEYPNQDKASSCGGQNVPCYRIDQGLEPCFAVDTWVQFDNMHEITRQELEDETTAGTARFLQYLDAQRFRSVLNCAKQSRDIRLADLAVINATLKSLNPRKAAPPTPSVITAPPEFATLRRHYERMCATCRGEFANAVELSAVDVAAVFAGSRAPAATFKADADFASDYIAETCSSCSR
jgi:hypothetical protein